MAAIYKLHQAFTNAETDAPKVFFYTSDAYSGIGTETGVTPVANPTGGELIIPIKELLRNATLVRIKVKLKNGTAVSYMSLLLARYKLPTVFTATGSTLDGKTLLLNAVNKGVIQTIHFQRDRRLIA